MKTVGRRHVVSSHTDPRLTGLVCQSIDCCLRTQHAACTHIAPDSSNSVTQCLIVVPVHARHLRNATDLRHVWHYSPQQRVVAVCDADGWHLQIREGTLEYLNMWKQTSKCWQGGCRRSRLRCMNLPGVPH
jgi:hypothetical protein